MQGDRKCVVSPLHKYNYCPKCGRGSWDETWRFMFCSERCHDIYKTIELWGTKKITPEDAKKKLDSLSALDIVGLREDLKRDINKIMSEAKAAIPKEKPVKINKEISVKKTITKAKETSEDKPKKPRSRKKAKPDIVNED